MRKFELCLPSLADEAEFISLYEEFMSSGGRIHPGVIKGYDGDFTAYIKKITDAKRDKLPGRVPGRIMFLKDESGKIYGAVSLRLELNEYLLRIGGHIGYGIRPSERGKGYGTLQLRLALEEMRKEGVFRVLVTCDKDNIASANVIMKCGGVLENEVAEEDGNIVKRYWIDVPEIVRVSEAELPCCLEVIRASFATVAQQFGLTEKNNPKHGTFMKIEFLKEQYDKGNLMFSYRLNEKIVGFCMLELTPRGYYLEKLAILPQYRHNGYGRMLIEHCKAVVKEKTADHETPEKAKIMIGIIEENTVLKEWYAKIGFVHTDTKKFEHLPFTVGFMEWVE